MDTRPGELSNRRCFADLPVFGVKIGKANTMKIAHSAIKFVVFFSLASIAYADNACHYMNDRSSLSGYDIGGPYNLEHFKMTKDRRDLREFLWNHWHDHTKGIAEAHVGTIDAGTVTALYVIQPDAKGQWGIDVELHRPIQPPPCSVFHADSLVRIPILKPNEDYPAQTLGPYFPDRKIPEKACLRDSDVQDAKYFWIVFVANEKIMGGSI